MDDTFEAIEELQKQYKSLSRRFTALARRVEALEQAQRETRLWQQTVHTMDGLESAVHKAAAIYEAQAVIER
jgi:prefoldin subunit 5